MCLYCKSQERVITATFIDMQILEVQNQTNNMIITFLYYTWEGYAVIGEQGWCSGESTHLPPMWPRFNSQTTYKHGLSNP